MKARLARRIFGLPRLADGIDVRRAHARLHGHVLARRRAAGSDSEGADELARLDEARDSLLRVRARAGYALALVSLAVLVAFAWYLSQSLLRGGGGDLPSLGVGNATVGSPAMLVVPASVPDAELTVVDSESGRTLLETVADGTVHPLDAGTVRVQVSHADCGPAWEREIELEAGERREVAADPCPRTGWIAVDSGEASDRIAIDGREIAATDSERVPLEAGLHDVQVEREGHETWEGRVEISAGQTLALRATPRRPSSGSEAAPRERKRASARAPRPIPADPEGENLPTRQWHQRTRQWLLSLYDHDRSDLLDTEEEVRAVPCRTWTGLADSVSKQRLALPFTRLYGFDGDGFVDGALGVSARVRDVAYRRMRECGLD